MKKKSTFSLFLLLICTALIGQPTITYNGNAPQIGDVYHQSYSQDQINPGPQGPNKTWDFSDFNVYETGEIYAIDVATTPFSDVFTDANIAFNYDGTGTFNYSKIEQNVAHNLGTGFDETPQMIIYYDDPAKLIEYPFFYNDEFTDTYKGEYEYQGLFTRQSGTLTKTADAWGVITTPAGTFENVIRLKTIRNQIDSVWMDDFFISKTVITYKDYEWYTDNSRVPVFAVTITASALINDTVSYYTTGTTIVPLAVQSISEMTILPNPATNQVQISFESTAYKQMQISIIDLMGREIIRKDYNSAIKGKQEVLIQINDIEAGLYFVQVNTGNEKLSKKLVIY